jgi:peptidoglycan/LPS O-acetylase OafA/YrhL
MYGYLAIIGSILIYFQKWFNRNFIKIIFLCIAIIAISANIVNHFQPFIIDDKFIRLFSLFFTGTAFYVWRNNIYLSLRIFFLLAIVLSLSIFEKELFFVIYSISIAYLIFYIAYVPAGIIRNFNKIGDYSYGIYIYAYPVQQSIVALMPNVSIPVMIGLSFFFTLLLSFLSWHLIEKKALKMKDYYVVFEKKLQIRVLAKKG